MDPVSAWWLGAAFIVGVTIGWCSKCVRAYQRGYVKGYEHKRARATDAERAMTVQISGVVSQAFKAGHAFGERERKGEERPTK